MQTTQFVYQWLLAFKINIRNNFFYKTAQYSQKFISDIEEEDLVLDAGTEDVLLSDYPADCCPDDCYRRFPFLAGDEDAPFWQGWGNLRLKTFQLIENKYFETAVITMILLSSMALVRDCLYCI